MERYSATSRATDSSADLAFDAWFSRTLRSMYEPVMHEDLPDELVAMLREIPRPH